MQDEYLECQQKVLGYVFYKGKLPALLQAMTRVQAKFFDADYRPLWNTFTMYNKKTTGMVDVQTMRSFLRAHKKIDEKRIFILEKLLEEGCREASEGVDDGGFNWYLGRLGEVYKQIKFAEIQDKSYQVLGEGGFDKARDYTLTALSELEGGLLETTPEGFIIDEVGSFIEDVSGQKHVRRTSAVDFGLPSLDNEVLGLRSGDMCLVLGWVGVGKTTLLVNSAVDMCFNQKKNVVFVTTETMRTQLKERIFSRITKMPDFGVPVSVRDMRSGELTGEQKESLLNIKPYIESRPHGVIMVTQAPASATMSWLTGKLLQYESMFKIDVLLLDDIRNMVPSPRRRQEYEEIAQLIRDFKRLARTHANRGIPVVSPYHINREMFKRARDENKRCDLSGLASSAEAERQTDVILLLSKDEQNIEMEILKMRAGRTGARIRLGVEFDYQLFYEMAELDDADL